MLNIISKFKAINLNDLNQEYILNILNSIELDNVNYNNYVPFGISTSYLTNKVLNYPFDILIMKWEPGCKTAIHEHLGIKN